MQIWRCLLMSASVVLLFVVAIKIYNDGELALPGTIEWDLDGIKEDLDDTLPGQEAMSTQLVNALQWTTKDADEINQKNAPRVKAIFLLGGPGVGKAQILDTVFEHVHCRYHGVFGIFPCTLKKHFYNHCSACTCSPWLTKSAGVHFNFVHMNLSSFSNSDASILATFESKLLTKDLSRRVVFVSGPVMKMSQMNKLSTNVTEYNLYLEKKAELIGNIMKASAPRVALEMVKFEPVRHSLEYFSLMEDYDVPYKINVRIVSNISLLFNISVTVRNSYTEETEVKVNLNQSLPQMST
ncbi:uncharacterized protein LOC132192755 [Neocloeon triangulifer]|uniref:uncharacterized protein LOC132192755 n=1 Tax=Neocloeon triangulifer TaxID=2078957 RepID=UPI00286EC0BC|nr:uncharacterized protein LOC132192755 [Neocloeon triangulifer]